MTWLRNKLRELADHTIKTEAEALRFELVNAKAAADRHKKAMSHAERTLDEATRELLDVTAALSDLRIRLDEAVKLRKWAERNLESALAEADLKERAEQQRDELRDKYMTLLETWEQQQPVIELAQWWRAYDHAPDPDPEVWARAESSLKRAIDRLPSVPAVRDGDNR